MKWLLLRTKLKFYFHLKLSVRWGKKFGWIVEVNSHMFCSDKIENKNWDPPKKQNLERLYIGCISTEEGRKD